MRILILLSLLLFAVQSALGGKFQVAFQWRSLNFKNLPANAPYDRTNPVPFGIARHKNRMFVGIARRAAGVPVTLAYINLNEQMQDPALTPYPNYQMNTLNVSRSQEIPIRHPKKKPAYQMNNFDPSRK